MVTSRINHHLSWVLQRSKSDGYNGTMAQTNWVFMASLWHSLPHQENVNMEGPGSSYKCTSVKTSQNGPQIHYNFGLQSTMADKGVTCHMSHLWPVPKHDKCQIFFLQLVLVSTAVYTDRITLAYTCRECGPMLILSILSSFHPESWVSEVLLRVYLWLIYWMLSSAVQYPVWADNGNHTQ